MFHYISGALTLLTPTFAVLDAGGVGFKLTVSANTYEAISPAARNADTVKLYTHMAVREDDMELFGFADEQELETFRLLITVSGVGPKAAMAILSSFTPEKFAIAVCSEDKKTIARANGIGPKTAARIILELHDKMAAGVTLPSTFDAFTASVPAAAAKTGGSAHLAEAQEALLVLGYNRTEIATALAGMDTASMDTEGIIRAALKKLM